jgi:hypothetical protein
MSLVALMNEAVELGLAEKKIAQQLPSLILKGITHPASHSERTKEIENVLYPMFQRNIFLERYIQRVSKKTKSE